MMKKALDHWTQKLDPRADFTDDDWENFYLDYDFQNVDELYLDDYQPLGFEWE